jgi:hypothetical protein
VPEDKGKDISDPARGKPEIRGGEDPGDWTGPMPAREGAPEPATPPGVSMPIVPGPQDELSELDT